MLTKRCSEVHAEARPTLPRSANSPRRIPYASTDRHGIIGDRRTAALIAADGTLDWCCLPDFDGQPLFGALLDSTHGGFWRLGPARAWQGKQEYLSGTATLQTSWTLDGGELCLADLMCWPQTKRDSNLSDSRAIIRTLQCTQGTSRCLVQIALPQGISNSAQPAAQGVSTEFTVNADVGTLHFWSNRPLLNAAGNGVEFELQANEEVMVVMTYGDNKIEWNEDLVRQAAREAEDYWLDRRARLTKLQGHPAEERAAMLIRLLTFAPTGAIVAAPTTSVPERIGGDWNSDYRLCWTRDSSLSLSLVSKFGDVHEAERYLHWLCGLGSSSEMPLQVLYGIRGNHKAPHTDVPTLAGYRNSQPVRVGNHAYRQLQMGSLGYLADCVYDFLMSGGTWRDEFWKLLQDVAKYVTGHWHEPDNGIWELPTPKHFVSSRVMAWVALHRIIQIAEKIGRTEQLDQWKSTKDDIHADVMDHGWCDSLNAFRQYYGAENLDASALLIPIFDFLEPNDPRVLATIDRIAQRLTIDQFVYRFDPQEIAVDIFGGDQEMMGQFEGAFLPCTFWLATAYAKSGQLEKAEEILTAVVHVVEPTGLLAESVDPRDGTFLGNFPLLFSHAEQVRAIRTLERHRAKTQ